MSKYNEITNRSSPNYWAGGNTKKGITIHWWGDPAQNPTAEGIVNWLCNPASQVSAHFVITGTGRRVWQLVNDDDRAWHALSGNASTIGMELDPRCRPEDYDVAAEVIADLWRAYGKLPLYPHKHFVNTACPGNYDLGRLQALAESKLNGTAPPQGGGNVSTIPDQDNYFWRFGQKTMERLRGRQQTRDEFRKTLVGLTPMRAIEVISDDPEADRAYAWQQLGRLADKDKWQQQIYDRTKERNDARTEAAKNLLERNTARDEAAKYKAEVADLKAQLTTQSDDTKNLNALGQTLQWAIKRLGLK